jgi:hypothetical protein
MPRVGLPSHRAPRTPKGKKVPDPFFPNLFPWKISLSTAGSFLIGALYQVAIKQTQSVFRECLTRSGIDTPQKM